MSPPKHIVSAAAIVINENMALKLAQFRFDTGTYV
jgi:hypothetical protein